MSALLAVWDLVCERCGLPCGLRAVTVRGRLGPCCVDVRRDVAPSSSPAERMAVDVLWASVKARRAS